MIPQSICVDRMRRHAVFSRPKHTEWYVLTAIIVGGVILRVWGIQNEPYGIDELQTVHNLPAETYGHFVNRLIPWATPPMPAYFAPIYFLYHYVSSSTFLPRLLALSLAPLTIVLAHIVARQLTDRKTALMAAGFLAFSPFFAYYSQEARFYAFLPFYATISVQTMLLGLECGRSRSWWYIHGTANTLLVFTHFLSGSLIVAQCTYLFLFYRKNRRLLFVWVFFHVILLISLLLWLGTLDVAHHVGALNQMGPPSLLRAIMVMMLVAGGVASRQDLHFDIRKPSASDVAAFLFVYGVLCGYLWHLVARFGKGERAECKKTHVLLFLWLVVPFALYYVFSLTGIPCFTSRYVLISLPPLCILLSSALCSIASVGYRRLAILTGVVIYGIQVLAFLDVPHRPDYARAIAHMAENRRPEDKILVVFRGNMLALVHSGRITRDSCAFVEPEESFAGAAEPLLRQNARLWVLVCMWTEDGCMGLKDFLAKDNIKSVKKVFSGWPDVWVLLLESPWAKLPSEEGA